MLIARSARARLACSSAPSPRTWAEGPGSWLQRVSEPDNATPKSTAADDDAGGRLAILTFRSVFFLCPPCPTVPHE
jgi:hypothetical protein